MVFELSCQCDSSWSGRDTFDCAVLKQRLIARVWWVLDVVILRYIVRTLLMVHERSRSSALSTLCVTRHSERVGSECGLMNGSGFEEQS